MKRLAAVLACAVAAAADPAQLRREVESLRPDRHAWREISWRTCPLEALAESRETGKPVLAWVFLGSPLDERC